MGLERSCLFVDGAVVLQGGQLGTCNDKTQVDESIHRCAFRGGLAPDRLLVIR